MILKAKFEEGQSVALAGGAWQWNYGTYLRIEGLNLEPVTEIHFSFQESGGSTLTQIGITKDNVTFVEIPAIFLENEDAIQDYKVYAFIYPATTEEGQTTHEIIINFTARPKPETFTSEEADVFKQVVEQLNMLNTEKMDRPLSGQLEQVVAVAGVDGKGRPNKFKAVDMTGGGGGGGKDGKSAYEIAVENGFRGTEKEWLASLNGKDGFSPSANVSKTEKTTTITITDKDGKTEAQVMDGKDGKDAISPIATVSKAGKTTTLTVTDKNGTTTAEILDGKDGGVPQDLVDKVNKNTRDIANKLDKNQGAENSGKILGISADGNVLPVEKPSGGNLPLEPLTFTGGAIGTYDGTEPLTVDIPTGGGGGSELICDLTNDREVKKFTFDVPNEYKLVSMYMNCKTSTLKNANYKIWHSGTFFQEPSMELVDSRDLIINAFDSVFIDSDTKQGISVISYTVKGAIKRTIESVVDVPLKFRQYGIETWGAGIIPIGSRLIIRGWK